jgi:putative transposase
MNSSDANARRLRLIEEVLRLSDDRLADVERFLNASTPRPPAANPEASPIPAERDWPHAPRHRLSEQGTYIVTAATYLKEHHFKGADRLDLLETTLLSLAKRAGWQLEAWAVFSNHYHFVGHARPGCESLKEWLSELHRQTAARVNQLDGRDGRRVWYNYWETELTFETSYFARLNYVHQNPVKHGLVSVANQYRWCSAAWFERTASPTQVRTIYAFKTDQVTVRDEFDPVEAG